MHTWTAQQRAERYDHPNSPHGDHPPLRHRTMAQAGHIVQPQDTARWPSPTCSLLPPG